jgi:hypothetical protein
MQEDESTAEMMYEGNGRKNIRDIQDEAPSCT